MADLDSGHLFLTFLVPIKPGGPKNGVSYKQNVRIELAKLPPAHQSPATQKMEYAAPFSRNTRTHFARMFVLDDAVYNGRDGENVLVSILKGVDTIVPKHVDHLKSAYLVFTADIDAVTADGKPLPATLSPEEQREIRMAYAQTLWDTMGEEIKAIFDSCRDFGGVDNGAKFGAYLERCHVETTMPFHDYYLELPEFNNLPLTMLGAAVGVPAVVAVVALLLRIFGMGTLFGINTLLLTVLALVLTLVAFVLAVLFALANGAKPLPPAKYDDLPTVLKALYLQQAFADFVAENQGRDAAALHIAFGEFIGRHKPSDIFEPTQRPGVISSAAPQPQARV